MARLADMFTRRDIHAHATTLVRAYQNADADAATLTRARDATLVLTAYAMRDERHARAVVVGMANAANAVRATPRA